MKSRVSPGGTSRTSLSRGRGFHNAAAAALRQFVVVGLLVHGLSAATAQPESPTAGEETPATTTAVSIESIEQLRQQITAATDLDEESRKTLLETCQKAIDAVTRAVKLESQKPLNQAEIEEITAKAKQLQSTLSQQNGKVLPDVSADASLAELMSALATRQPALQEARSKLATLEAEPGRRTERRTAIAQDLAAHASEKTSVENELKAAPPADESPYTTAARRALLLATQREINAKAPAWQAELSRYDAEKAVDLTGLRVQVAKKEVARLQQEVDELTKRITTKRSQDARYIAEQLELFAQGQPAASPYRHSTTSLFEGALTQESHLRLAAETAELASQNVDVTAQLTTATKDVNQAQQELEAIRTLKTRTTDKISRVGLTGAIGLELRRHLRNLADPREIRRRCRERQDVMRDIEFRRLALDDQEPLFAARAEELERSDIVSDSERIDLRLTADRLTTLSTLENSYGELFSRLGELDASEQELIREIHEFDTFIRERVLWIRSHPSLGTGDVRDLGLTARWLFAPARWKEFGFALRRDAEASVWQYLVFAGLITLLFSVQRRFRRTLSAIGELAAKNTCREFRLTGRAAALTLILSLAWPAIPAFLSWRLLTGRAGAEFIRAAGYGFFAVAAGFLTLNLLRQLCRPSGLGLSHFGWPANAVRLVRLRIYGLMVVMLPLLFVENVLHAMEILDGRDSLERITFIGSLLVLAHFEIRVLHPVNGVFRDYLAENSTGWACRLKWPLYGLVVAVPFTLSILAVIGFYYTAWELTWRLHVLTWAITGLFVIRSFLVRWYVVRHRELRLQQARQRRQALTESAQASSDGSSASHLAAVEDPVDLQEVSEQTQRLVDSGLAIIGLVITWFVWVDVLPALGVLDRWELWRVTINETVEFTDENGIQGFRVDQKPGAVTAADVLIALAIALLTLTGARNIPGLLEITLLNRLPLDAATRYAVRTVARYSIFVIGMVLGFNAIGIGWAKVQWLAAGLTVGLGFGLQEIFANFVSGLIILFERPVRIADVVTIGDVTGSVSRIQIRATTITDWDRKEYIVPNREFVTGRLLNWTLSDKTNRAVILVGVAYGSDTVLARSLLLNVAHQHPNVLDDPPPIATFESFGDSALNLCLRCYLPNLENRLITVTELYEAIDREFKSAGIEISFPQRDVHLRTVVNGVGLPQIQADQHSQTVQGDSRPHDSQ